MMRPATILDSISASTIWCKASRPRTPPTFHSTARFTATNRFSKLQWQIPTPAGITSWRFARSRKTAEEVAVGEGGGGGGVAGGGGGVGGGGGGRARHQVRRRLRARTRRKRPSPSLA